MQWAVEIDGMAGIAEQCIKATDFVGHGGVGVMAVVESTRQGTWQETLVAFEQPEQIDKLVIAPIADVAPRVFGVVNLPVDALAGDPIGVVAVCGRGIEKHSDH